MSLRLEDVELLGGTKVRETVVIATTGFQKYLRHVIPRFQEEFEALEVLESSSEMEFGWGESRDQVPTAEVTGKIRDVLHFVGWDQVMMLMSCDYLL